MCNNKETKLIKIKNIAIGGNSPIAIQSMTNTDTLDYDSTIEQVNKLYEAGCDIVRIAVSTKKEAESCKKIIAKCNVPLVADIQFDYKLAIMCADIGFNKIRFNPGNIGSEDKIKKLVDACKVNNVPIRIGVNSGSIEKDILSEFGNTAKALVMSATRHIAILEKLGFYDIVISIKSSTVNTMVEANQILKKSFDYPLHIGVTESGAYEHGLVKSAIGIGALLLNNIGDTIRVSLSGDPLQEPLAAKIILDSLNLNTKGCEIVSCPTCSRCKYDLMAVVDKVRELTKNIDKKLKIAVMGCVVNGPGEARDADLGIAGGKEKSIIFKKGEVVATVENERALLIFEQMIKELL